jgi:hypothetical protein
MATLRTLASVMLSKGVTSAGWYAILTGLALLAVTCVLASVADSDPVAPFVAVLFAVAGVWQLERGVRSQLQRPGR